MHLNVITTLRCNLRCAHCLFACPAAGDLDVEAYDRILSALAPHRLRSVTLTGGEPCTHPDFAALVGRTVGHRLRFGIVSNAWDFGAYEEAVRRHRALFTEFHLSLDGLEATHDRARGRGSFGRVTAALARCRELGVGARVNFVLSDLNRGELEGVVAHCRDAGAAGIKLGGLIPTERAPGVRLSPAARESAAEEAPVLSGRHGIPIEVASSLLTPAAVEFCGVINTSTLTLNERCEITWCCDLPGGAATLGAGSDPAPEVLARRARARHEIALDRILKLRGGGFALEDRSCAYCHAFFGVAAVHGA